MKEVTIGRGTFDGQYTYTYANPGVHKEELEENRERFVGANRNELPPIFNVKNVSQKFLHVCMCRDSFVNLLFKSLPR
jgi:hypothetical protein